MSRTPPIVDDAYLSGGQLSAALADHDVDPAQALPEAATVALRDASKAASERAQISSATATRSRLQLVGGGRLEDRERCTRCSPTTRTSVPPCRRSGTRSVCTAARLTQSARSRSVVSPSPALPGVVIGHNDRIAWGFTNLSPDVTDLYPGEGRR